MEVTYPRAGNSTYLSFQFRESDKQLDFDKKWEVVEMEETHEAFIFRLEESPFGRKCYNRVNEHKEYVGIKVLQFDQPADKKITKFGASPASLDGDLLIVPKDTINQVRPKGSRKAGAIRRSPRLVENIKPIIKSEINFKELVDQLNKALHEGKIKLEMEDGILILYKKL